MISEIEYGRLHTKVAKLEAELLAHKENEGDECPLCVLEAELKATYELLDVYEKENERLKDGIQKIITTLYPVMYDNDKVGLALVALLNDALKEDK